MKRVLLAVVSCLLLAACASSQIAAPVRGVAPAPPEERAALSGGRDRQSAEGYYVVQRDDTLYSIAWQSGLDYKTLAGWNGIKAPYRIYAGQKLQLTAPANRVAETTRPPATAAAQRKPSSSPAEQKPSPESPATDDEEGTSAGASPSWLWPTRGELIAGFNAGDNKGINIAGREGDTISAAAEGRVVYSGSGLVGLGELVIIKHNGSFLSAYAHNKARLVKEGDLVKSGQTIAQMGRTGTDRVMLHFEVRKDGKPVDPLQYLPRLR